MAYSRTYSSQLIPANPSAADFETTFRSNTDLLQTATQDIDDEVTTARGVSLTLGARLTGLEGTAGVSASFWTIDAGAAGTNGQTLFTIAGVNSTTTYYAGRAIRIITSAGTSYGYVSSSSFSTNTTVNIVTNAGGTAFTINGTVTSIAYSTSANNNLDLVTYDQLASTTTATLSGTSVAMAIALG